MEIVRCRQSSHCTLLFSTGHRVCRMSSTRKWTNLLPWVTGLADLCSAEALLVNFAFCLQLLYHQTLTSPLCNESPCTQQRNTQAGAGLCCGTPGARMPEKYKLDDHIPSFCWTYPGKTDNYFFFRIKWPIASDARVGEKVVSLLQNEEKPVHLAGCEWSEP